MYLLLIDILTVITNDFEELIKMYNASIFVEYRIKGY